MGGTGPPAGQLPRRLRLPGCLSSHPETRLKTPGASDQPPSSTEAAADRPGGCPRGTDTQTAGGQPELWGVAAASRTEPGVSPAPVPRAAGSRGPCARPRVPRLRAELWEVRRAPSSVAAARRQAQKPLEAIRPQVDFQDPGRTQRLHRRRHMCRSPVLTTAWRAPYRGARRGQKRPAHLLSAGDQPVLSARCPCTPGWLPFLSSLPASPLPLRFPSWQGEGRPHRGVPWEFTAISSRQASDVFPGKVTKPLKHLS